MSLRSSESRARVSTVSISVIAPLYLAFQERDMVTGGETAPTIAVPLSLRLPRISVVRNELVVEGKSKRRGEENNMDMEVGTHDEGAAKGYFKYLSIEGDVISPCRWRFVWCCFPPHLPM